MKRFFCTKCNRVRRARILPVSVKQGVFAVSDRTGICDSHHYDSRSAYTNSNRPASRNIKPVKIVKTVVTSVSKKGRK